MTSPERRTFTYCKPLVVEEGRAPVELNRLDSKNWTPTPESLTSRLANGLREIAPELDALIVLEQVDQADTGVVTRAMLDVIGTVAAARPDLPILADSRRGLAGWPGLSFKMNAAELAALVGQDSAGSLDAVKSTALDLARRNHRPVFVTLAERGIVGAAPDGTLAHTSRAAAPRSDRHRRCRRRRHGEPGHGPGLGCDDPGSHRAGRGRVVDCDPSTGNDGDGECG